MRDAPTPHPPADRTLAQRERARALARASVPANDVDAIPSHRLRSMAR